MPPLKTSTAPRLPLTRRRDGWWITSIPLEDFPEAGPYRTRQEAAEDRAGLLRWFAAWARLKARAA